MASPERTRVSVQDLDDYERYPDDERTRYEVVDGELFVSRAPGNPHQYACTVCTGELHVWNRQTDLGVVLIAPGIIFDDFNAVQPDLVRISREQLAVIGGEDQHLHGAPELVVEVLSPGRQNERRDRQAKLALYGQYGVLEYWIVDPRARTVEAYRLQGQTLQRAARLSADAELTSPTLPGFTPQLAQLFAGW